MGKRVFILLVLALFITSCDYESTFCYKMSNHSEYPLNVSVDNYYIDTTYIINPKETKYIYCNTRLTGKRVNAENSFLLSIDTINIYINDSLKICKDYLLCENWFFDLGQNEEDRIYTYWLKIENTDICSKK